ncbi:MAG: cell division protein ZapE, partial [Sphingomonadaceae bacterium]|nr:cell division protein ZapE [Sphingomonadaceae bacterium]
MVAAGELRPDPCQAAAADRLYRLRRALETAPPPGLFGRLFAPRPTLRKGIYLWGGVGRGKSMLMDLFFASADVPRKRRIHFHRFMQDAHARIHAWKQANPSG